MDCCTQLKSHDESGARSSGSRHQAAKDCQKSLIATPPLVYRFGTPAPASRIRVLQDAGLAHSQKMRALLSRSRSRGKASLPANGCSPCGGGGHGGEVLFELHHQALSSTAGASRVGVRKRMMPLIKLVHPDMFAQHPPDVASTNSKSLKVCCVCLGLW